VNASLAAIEAMRPTATSVDAPLTTRAVGPVLRALGRLASRLTTVGGRARIQRNLDQAGNPADWSPERIVSMKGVALVVLGVLGALVGLERGVVVGVIFGAVAGTGGFFLPDLIVYNLGLRRQEKIRKTLSEVLDMLTICVEAGLAFDAALRQVAMNTQGPLADEIFRVLQEMQFGRSRSEALRSMADRTSVAELRSTVVSLIQATDLGMPMGRVLREQAKEMRLKRRQRAEELAQKVPVKILFPLIFCILPSLFIVVIGPGALGIAKAFSGL
jgi:tight adherence protein C